YPKAIIKKCEPEVKQDEVVIDECRMVEIPEKQRAELNKIADVNGIYIEANGTTRTREFRKKSFYLGSNYEWGLAQDGGNTILVPRKKENNECKTLQSTQSKTMNTKSNGLTI